MKRLALLVLTLLAFVAFAPRADAHTRSQSQSRWTIDGDALDVVVETDAVEATRLYALGGDAPLPETFAAEVGRSFDVRADGRACAAQGAPRGSLSAAGRISARLQFRCPDGALARGPVEIESRLFYSVAPSHLHFLALHDAQGHSAEAVLTEPHPRASLSPQATPQSQTVGSLIARFLPIGAEHVWTGLDHVAFILALTLLATGDLRRIILAATGFTLGHTATLGLAATGVLRPDSHSIEALIGFTIAFVALEAGVGGKERMRAWSTPIAALLATAGAASLGKLVPMSPLVWFGLAAFVYAYPRGFPRGATWLAMIFGLIHGCGFAGALATLDLPRPHLLASLFGFNVGVEVGQVVVVGVALLVAFAARRAPETLRTNAASLAGAALFALGAFWFASRLIAI